MDRPQYYSELGIIASSHAITHKLIDCTTLTKRKAVSICWSE